MTLRVLLSAMALYLLSWPGMAEPLPATSAPDTPAQPAAIDTAPPPPPLPGRPIVALGKPGTQIDLKSKMDVRLMRGSSYHCKPHCPAWIAAQGQIDQSTPKEFSKIIAKLHGHKVPVLINSGGGHVDAALQIGRILRKNGLDVVVAATQLRPCEASDPACRKENARGYTHGIAGDGRSVCASACVFLLAGGKRRFIGPEAWIGLHQVKTIVTRYRKERTYEQRTKHFFGIPVSIERRLIKERVIPQGTSEVRTNEAVYAMLAHYFSEMGLSESINRHVKLLPNDKMNWLTREEIRSTRLATDEKPASHLLGDASIRMPMGTELKNKRFEKGSTDEPTLSPLPIDDASQMAVRNQLAKPSGDKPPSSNSADPIKGGFDSRDLLKRSKLPPN